MDFFSSIQESLGKKGTFAIVPSPVPFDVRNFKELHAKKGRISFVDGGNAEIFSSNAFSVHFFRIYGCTYDGSRLVSSMKKEFRALITGNKAVLDTGEELSLPSPDLVRRYAEVCLAQEMNAVLDGNLIPENDLVAQKLVGLHALSKTNELVTDAGTPVSFELSRLSPFRQWWYYPVSAHAEIIMAKLHEKSSYVFKLEAPKNFNPEIVSLLAFHASDPVFLGYPYGLLHAHQQARVSSQEQDYLRFCLLARLKNPEAVSQYLNTMNAHDVLDAI